jgi:hypothetical protein
MTTNSITHIRMSMIFNEWAERFAKNPDDFGDILNEDGTVVSDYGECSATYFNKIADELDSKNLLPRP